MLVNLNALLPQAAAKSYAVAGFNVFGFEDARAVIQAAEKLSTGVILMANRDSLAQIPVEHFGPMLARLAEAVRVPVCVHLDHTDKEADIIRAIKAGFSSVMFDGSQLPLEENIDRTRRVVEMAHAVDVTVEGEVGSVGYNEPNKMIETVLTDPKEAGAFAHRGDLYGNCRLAHHSNPGPSAVDDEHRYRSPSLWCHPCTQLSHRLDDTAGGRVPFHLLFYSEHPP